MLWWKCFMEGLWWYNVFLRIMSSTLGIMSCEFFSQLAWIAFNDHPLRNLLWFLIQNFANVQFCLFHFYVIFQDVHFEIFFLFIEIIGNGFCYAKNNMWLAEIVCKDVVREVGSLHSHPLTKLVLEEITTTFGFANYSRICFATSGFVEED